MDLFKTFLFKEIALEKPINCEANMPYAGKDDQIEIKKERIDDCQRTTKRYIAEKRGYIAEKRARIDELEEKEVSNSVLLFEEIESLKADIKGLKENEKRSKEGIQSLTADVKGLKEDRKRCKEQIVHLQNIIAKNIPEEFEEKTNANEVARLIQVSPSSNNIPEINSGFDMVENHGFPLQQNFSTGLNPYTQQDHTLSYANHQDQFQTVETLNDNGFPWYGQKIVSSGYNPLLMPFTQVAPGYCSLPSLVDNNRQTSQHHILIQNRNQNQAIQPRGHNDTESSVVNTDLSKSGNNDLLNTFQNLVYTGNMEMCRYLIQKYPELVNRVDDEGRNAAFYAAARGNVQILELLIDNNVNMKHTNKKSNILNVACGNARLEMCQYIISRYPDMLHDIDINGWNAALMAAAGGNVQILQLLIDNDVNMKHRKNDKANILHVACSNARLEMCQYIISRYPDMLHDIDINGWNAALKAALGGNVQILQLLIDNDVNMKHRINDKANILHVACSNARLEMCQYIISRYPDMLHDIDINGWNAALMAAAGGNVQILQLLIDNDVNMKHRKNDKANILHVACSNARLEMCQYIISRYPDMLHDIDINGWNAALMAAAGGNVQILQLLIDNDVNMKHRKNDKANILHVACSNARLEMCQYIISRYPDMLHDIDINGWNAALKAALGGNVQILQLLIDNDVNMKHRINDKANILHVACSNARLEMCQYIISRYPDMLHDIDINGWNAALMAAAGGNVQILQLLIDNDVNMKHRKNDKANILHVACSNARLEMCQYIISRYPDMLHDIDINGWNAALMAAAGGNVQILQLLIDNDVNMKHRKNDKANILHVACSNARLEMCQYIISRYPDMLHDIDINGWNAALKAALGGNVQILQLLIDNDVNMKHRINDKANILHVACSNARLEMCQYIISRYPDMLHDIDINGWNAALMAAAGGNVQILQLLIDNDVNMKHRKNDKANILHVACSNARLEMCQYIISRYPDMLHDIDINGWNAALMAAAGGNVQILQLLIDNDVNMKHRKNDKANILHVACSNARLEMCQYIISRYPDMLHDIDINGWNAALMAAAGGNVQILQLLIDNDVNMKHRKNDKANILHVACSNARLEMCQYIISRYPDMLHDIDINGWNAALKAALGGNVQILQLLIDNDVNMKHRINDKANILHVACSNARLEMCQYIISRYSDMLHDIDINGWNAALMAAAGGNVQILQLLIDNDVNMKHRKNDKANILHVACSNARLEMCQYIISRYPDMLHDIDINGWNAALIAAQGGNVQILQLLIDNDVNMKHRINSKANILHVACGNARLEMCQYIISRYPDMLHDIDINGWNAALMAALGGNVQILQLLIDNNVNMKHRSNDKSNILHVGCSNARLEMCQYIISRYPDMLHDVDNNGRNASHCVASEVVLKGDPVKRNSEIDIVDMLAGKGLSLYELTRNGETVLTIACQKNKTELCRHLVAHYPALFQISGPGVMSPVVAAIQSGNIELVEMIEKYSK